MCADRGSSCVLSIQLLQPVHCTHIPLLCQSYICSTTLSCEAERYLYQVCVLRLHLTRQNGTRLSLFSSSGRRGGCMAARALERHAWVCLPCVCDNACAFCSPLSLSTCFCGCAGRRGHILRHMPPQGSWCGCTGHPWLQQVAGAHSHPPPLALC
jgi:hypothetical protein